MEKAQKISVIRYIYLYLVTAITIVLIIISAIGLIKIALNEYVFEVKTWEQLEDPKLYYECSEDMLFYSSSPKGERVLKDPTKTRAEMDSEKEECLKNAKERREMQHINQVKTDLVWWLSMLIVALPLYLFHWGVIKRDQKKSKND